MRPARANASRAAALVALALVFAAERAAAQPAQPNAQARAAYDRGTSAFGRGEYAAAATEYALADELAPNPIALESALKAALRADEPALAMELVGRSSRAPAPPSLASLVKLARDRFGGRVAQVTVVCPGGASCQASIDGASVPVGIARWIPAGAHQVDLSVNGRVEHRNVSVVGGAAIEVQSLSPADSNPTAAPVREYPASDPGAPVPRPPAREASPSMASETSGISPAWFFGFAAISAVAAGFTVGSAIDAQNQYNAWKANHTDASKSDAESGALRTNILLGATAVCVVSTAVIGIFAVRWSRPAKRAPAALDVFRF